MTEKNFIDEHFPEPEVDNSSAATDTVQTESAVSETSSIQAAEYPTINIDDPFTATIVAALKEIYDPEIPVNIYDLGLIYGIHINDEKEVKIDMTLTTPGCPVAQSFPISVADAVRDVEGVTDATVELVWDPPWTMDRMTEEARVMLGMF